MVGKRLYVVFWRYKSPLRGGRYRLAYEVKTSLRAAKELKRDLCDSELSYKHVWIIAYERMG